MSEVLCSVCGEWRDGDLFHPEEEYYCYECLAEMEQEEAEEFLDKRCLVIG